MRARFAAVVAAAGLAAAGCGGDDAAAKRAFASIRNDFDDPAITGFQPPWTICRSSYLGVSFGQIAIGEASPEKEVEAGSDHVLMVAAWNDPGCSPQHALPIASAGPEEVVPGQHRTLVISLPNHQGPCPPQGVAPMAQAQYDRIRALWPEFAFQPYDQRTKNPQCGG